MAIETGDMMVFLAVVREGSFGRAASSLLLSQPSVSERIAGLERGLGTTLFDRSTRGTTMTPAGERFLPYAQRAVGLLDEASQAVRAIDQPPPLRIAVHVTFAHRAVPLVLGAIGARHRSIKVRDAHSDEIIAMLLDGVVDIGFVLPGTRPPPLRFIPLPADPVIAVSAPGHALAARRDVPLRALAGHRVALNRWGTGAAAFLDQLVAAGVPERQWTECSDGVTALRLARHHGHIALVTSSIAIEDIADSKLIRLRLRPTTKWSVPLALAYRARDRDDAPIAAMRDALRPLAKPRRAGR